MTKFNGMALAVIASALIISISDGGPVIGPRRWHLGGLSFDHGDDDDR